MKLRHLWFVLVCFLLALVAYAQLPSMVSSVVSRTVSTTMLASWPPTHSSELPKIEAFSASAPVVVSGDPVTLSWRIAGAAGSSVRLLPSVGEVRGQRAILYPVLSTDYTLLLQNPAGSVQRDLRVEVQQTPLQPGVRPGAQPGAPSSETATPQPDRPTTTGGTQPEDDAPSGSFGVSANASGPFFSDRAGSISVPDDERIVRVAPGSAFFAQASFSDPDGITGVVLNLVNSAPEALGGALTPTRPPFTVDGEPDGACNLTALPTEVRCVFRVEVAADAQNIDELPGSDDEFAYVFRVRVTDGLGNSASRAIRGYVIVE